MKNKILIDIKHPAQLNLFRGLSQSLKKSGWEVTVCYLERGKLPAIIKKEYNGFNTIPVGSSHGTKWSIFWDGNVKRTSFFMGLIRKNHYNICIAASSAPLALACKLTSTPILQFYDDPERRRINQINALLSDKLYFPPIVDSSAKIEVFNCLKEWSYLSPAYFKPDPKVLGTYGLTPHSYIFVREVSNKSFNYMDQEDAVICGFSSQLDPKIPVLISLEDKSIKGRFPSQWIHLDEPVGDIHSLMYYSKLVLSSGDSMAREGAMLGVPSIYCGIREMKANELLMEKRILRHAPGNDAVSVVNSYANIDFDVETQIQNRNDLLDDWDDMNEFMTTKINKYKK